MLGALEGGIDGPDPPLGAGALGRERQRGHRPWLPDPGARADPLDGPRAARPCSVPGGHAACSQSQRASVCVEWRLETPASFPNALSPAPAQTLAISLSVFSIEVYLNVQ